MTTKKTKNSRTLESYDLKILHQSDMHLPDWRIEKSASTDLNLGHEVVFAGMKSNYAGSVFSRTLNVDWTPRARRGIPFYWHSVKKQLERVLKETRPDVVHAHNISLPRWFQNLEYHLYTMTMNFGQFMPKYNQRPLDRIN
jgi:hypothetical protein